MGSEISVPPDLAFRHSPRAAADPSQAAAKIGAAWADRFAGLAGLTGDMHVLDIGCGPGRVAIAIGEKFNWTNPYLGFDIFPEDIAFAKQAISSQHPNFEFAHLDVRNEYYRPEGALSGLEVVFPTPAATIDFAFATSVFTHFFEADTRHYITQAYKALKPGGTFLATYFLMPAGYRATPINPGARFRLAHQVGAHSWIAHPAEPGKVVGFDLDFIRQLYAETGFDDFSYKLGSWNSAPWAVSGQDIVIARKPMACA